MPIPQRFRLVILWAIAAVVLASNIIYLIYLLTVPHDGVAMGAFGGFRSEGAVAVRFVLPGGTDAVQKGDWITHINGEHVDTWFARVYKPGSKWNFNAPVTYTLLRPLDVDNPEGPREELTARVTPGQLSPLKVLFHLPTLPLMGVTFLGVALLAFGRRQRDSSAQLFWIIALNMFAIGVNDPVDYQVLSLIRPPVFWVHYLIRDMTLNMGSTAASLGLAMTFPRRFDFAQRHRRWLFPLMMAVPLVTPWMVFAFTPPGLTRVLALTNAMLAIMVVYLLATVAFFVANFFTTRDPVQRMQVRWVSWGIAVGILPVVVGFLAPRIFGVRFLTFEAVAFSLLAIPVGFAIAIARYRLWDIDVVINRSIVYSIVLGLLGAVYLVVVTALQWILLGLTGAESDLAIVSTTALIAAIFLPVRNRVQDAVNNTLFAEQHAARLRLRQFGRQVENVVDLPLLLEQLLDHVCKPLNVSAVFILLPDEDSGNYETAAMCGQPIWQVAIEANERLKDILERGRMVIQPSGAAMEGISLAVPLIAFGELVGVLALAEREGGQDYNADDREALRDVADQAALAIRVAKLQAKLIAIERFSAVGAAASSIVHDIKNQMGAASGYAELLSRPNLGQEDRERFAKILQRVIQGFSLMATEILDLARGESHIRPKPVTVRSCFEELNPLLQQLCDQSNIILDIDLKYDDKLLLDSPRIQRVFFNLCDNSHHALLSIHPPDVRLITITNAREGDWVVFRVSDNGPGVPQEIRENLFNPFMTAQKSEGAGLGLSIVKKVVVAHGGDIALDTGMPVGATFVIRLPLYPPTQAVESDA
jgi:signal transduction histidine kinase